MLKKVLSLGLITLFLFQAIQCNLCTSYAWSFSLHGNKASENIANACEKLNKYDKLENLDCAIDHLKKLLPGANFKYMDKVGKKGEYNIYLWDYLSLSSFPMHMGRLLKDAQQGYVCTDAATNVTNEIGGLLRIDETASKEVLLKFLHDNEYIKLSDDQILDLINQIILDLKEDKDSSTAAGFLGGAVGGAVGVGIAAKVLTLATAGILSIGTFGAVGIGGACYSLVSWWNSSNRKKELEKHKIEIQNYASALKQLLGHVQKGNWKYADSVLAQLNFDPKSYSSSVTMTTSGIKYPKSLEKQFNNKFKELEIDLTNMIDERQNLKGEN